jgi:hypothetical protein
MSTLESDMPRFVLRRRRRPVRRLVVLLCAALAAGCSNDAAVPPPVTTAPAAAAPAPPPAAAGNVLTMTLDGKPWKADREIFGAFDPPGMARRLIMAGSFGPKDANEQTFNLNVAGVDKPGRYVVRTREASVGNAAQVANLSRERYLVGGALGFDVTVDVDVLARNPTRIDARFSGTLTANDGATVVVADGRFRYSE